MSRYIAGEVIADKYRLVRPLGEGGMGALWVAQNLALDVQVALKLIRADIASDSASDRLLNEARTAARLKHPSIVRIFDFGRTRRGDPFIVMELLTGQSLGEHLETQRRLPATYTIQLLLPIAEALAAAHRHGIVHRDLKPDNVFLAESDGRLQPKIVDFGIAKLSQEPASGRLTQDGALLGSPEYMSPEQARGDEHVDHRADIWSFCVMLYECVTGVVPFSDDNYNALLRRIIEREPVSILDLSTGDRELWNILSRGLHKDQDERWQRIRELGDALAGWLVERGVTEDICGHSLRASWLDTRGFTAEEIPTGPRRISRPQAPPLPPRADAEIERLESADILPAEEAVAGLPRRSRATRIVLLAAAFAALAAVTLSSMQRSYSDAQRSTNAPAVSLQRVMRPVKVAARSAVVEHTRELDPRGRPAADTATRRSTSNQRTPGNVTTTQGASSAAVAPPKPPTNRQPRTRDRRRNSTYEDLGF
ncbi:MAG TPA: serine/threonine-protein kinase [Polyangiaceae bacterium]